MDLRYSCYKVPGLSSPILDSQHTAFLDDRYRLREQLGLGQFGLIRACSDLHTGEALACKSISKARLVSADDVRSVKLEIEIMAKLSGHPNVVDLKAVYEEQDYVHLVMELCSGGELFHRLEKRGRFLERDAAVLFRHLMEVLIYCHDHGVVHRDLKPENILLATKSSSSPIKLADFGLATYIEPGQRLCGTVGSPLYIAPEVLAGSYNQAADVWSAGVILYVLLSGVPPFWGKTKSKIFDAVRSLELRFPSDPWDGVSESAKLLVAGMLCRDSAQRLTAKQVIEHSWIQEFAHQVVHEADNCHQTVLRFAKEESESCSSLSSLLINCRASSSPYVINPAAGFSFPSAMELSAPIPLLPGFSFFGASSSGDQESILNLISNDAKGDLIHREPSFCELFTCGDEEGGGGGRRGVAAVGLRSKRNRTIGFGEHEQLDLTASEYVIRWASCAHLHGAASLGSSLVC